MKVLAVVEDDPGMTVLIEEALSDDDRLEVVKQATSLEEALELARRVQPHLIILDHFLEGDVMGLQAAAPLKEAAPMAKIVLFSSHNLAVEATREPAIDAFLLKRDLQRLLSTVQEVLGIAGSG